jgi:hypothetical protein
MPTAMKNDDLWPADLGNDSVPSDSPLLFLRKQATALGARTKNIVEAEVETTVEHLDAFIGRALGQALGEKREKSGIGTRSDYVVYRFVLRARALGDYRYVLFRAYHRLEDAFPLALRQDGGFTKVASEEDLAKCLRRIFSAESTRKVIATLRAQSAEHGVRAGRRRGASPAR